MNAYMHPNTARALLKQAQDWTAAKRQEAAERVRIANAKSELRRIGWTDEAAQELAEIYVRGVRS
jgi:hypothetical protein